MSLTQQILDKWKELRMSDYSYTPELREDDDWIISIEPAEDDPEHYAIVTYKTIEEEVVTARVPRKSSLQRMKELEDKNIR